MKAGATGVKLSRLMEVTGWKKLAPKHEEALRRHGLFSPYTKKGEERVFIAKQFLA